MANREPIQLNEWYHCYNRGVDKRRVFLQKADYERFLLLIHTSNSSKPVRTFNLRDKRLKTVLSDISAKQGDSPLVEIGAYSLMPNHFHLAVRETVEGGIALFMQKLFTGYTMYFNKKNERTGALFAGTFKSKHVANDAYLRRLVPYIHLNPVELFDPTWKTGAGSSAAIEKRLIKYPYSSLPDFLGTERPERKLLGNSIFDLFYFPVSPRLMLDEAKAYYESLGKKL